jgi:hypothetical protein
VRRLLPAVGPLVPRLAVVGGAARAPFALAARPDWPERHADDGPGRAVAVAVPLVPAEEAWKSPVLDADSQPDSSRRAV